MDLLNSVFSTHLIDFLLRVTEQERKSALNIEVMRLSRHPRQCILHVSENTLQQVETFKYLGVVFTSDGNRNKGLDTRISKPNAVLCRGGSNQYVQGAISVIFGIQVSLRVHYCKRDEVYFRTAVTKQYMTEWAHIANVVLRIVKNYGE